MKKFVAVFLMLIMTAGLMSVAGCALVRTNTDSGSGSADATSKDAALSTDGEVYTLVVQNHDPAFSTCGQYIEAWGRVVEEASGGRIRFEYRHGGTLVGADDAVKAVSNGTADICWSAAAIYSGQFPISEFIQLPLSGITCARMGCDVMQDMYREVPALQAEYKDYKVIMLGSCTYAPISTTDKKLLTVKDIQGLRIRAPGSTCALWCSAIGMSPMSVATPETYQYMKSGIIDGCLNDWHNIAAYKLYDNFSYIMDFPTPGSPIFMLMNKQTYETLPLELRMVIDRYSGDYATRMAGIYWDSTRSWICDYADEFHVEVYQPSDELYAALTDSKAKEKVHEQYIEYLNGFGLDGQAIYNKCMQIVSRYTEKYADPWAESVTIEDFKG